MRMLRWFPAPMLFCTLVAPLAAIGQTSGPSVNMVSGTGWTNGDPFLQSVSAMRSFVRILCAADGAFDQFADWPPNIPNYDLCIAESKLAGPLF